MSNFCIYLESSLMKIMFVDVAHLVNIYKRLVFLCTVNDSIKEKSQEGNLKSKKANTPAAATVKSEQVKGIKIM